MSDTKYVTADNRFDKNNAKTLQQSASFSIRFNQCWASATLETSLIIISWLCLSPWANISPARSLFEQGFSKRRSYMEEGRAYSETISLDWRVWTAHRKQSSCSLLWRELNQTLASFMLFTSLITISWLCRAALLKSLSAQCLWKGVLNTR